MKIDELPRKAVLGYLELTRLPLTAAERALGKTESAWAPTIAFDRIQAKVKDVVGGVLRDETLRADARLQMAALDERVRAAALEATADEVRTEAVVHEAAAERQVAKKTVAKKQTARRVADAQDEALQKRETAAQRESLAKESKALNDQRAAAEAKAEVLDLEDKLDEAKTARKSG